MDGIVNLIRLLLLKWNSDHDETNFDTPFDLYVY